MLIDNHGREINYMRLAVTDRCNLRCFYCMPEEGINYVPRKDLLSFEEMERVVSVFYNLGITKLRLTGGEPFVRKGLMDFVRNIAQLDALKLHITTNGTLIDKHLEELKLLGIRSINLSLDSLDANRFKEITRTDHFETVMNCLEKMKDLDFDLKINMVVMKDRNIEDLIPMIMLADKYDISVRFIEEMPFNGTGKSISSTLLHKDILHHIESHFGKAEKLQDPKFSTSMNYSLAGLKGSFGIIAAYSRTFCGTCNRIRMTPIGLLKTCLYDQGVFNIRDLIRQGASDEDLIFTLKNALSHRAKDGFEAEANRQINKPVSESMATIGG